MYRHRNRSSVPGIVLAVILVIVLGVVAFSCNYALRQHKINQCEDRGGKAITHSVWDGEDYYKVGCIEPGEVQR